MNRLRTFGMSSSEYVSGLSCTVTVHVVGNVLLIYGDSML